MTSHAQQQFLHRKSRILSKRDKSSAGRIDARAVSICAAINDRNEYYTTSSCSGRCFLYVGDGIKSWHSTAAAAGSNKGVSDAVEAIHKMGFFQRFRVSHGRITTPLQYFNLQTLLTDATGGCGDAIPSVGQFESFGNNAAFAAKIDSGMSASRDDGLNNEIDTPIWLRYEPFILHVMCRSLKAASVLMALARPSFKNVGLTSWNSNVDDEEEAGNDSNTGVIQRVDENQQCKGGGAKYLVAIWGDEGLDMPLSLPSSPQCGLYYNPDNKDTECNAEWLAQLVNERHVRNWSKIDRFVDAVKGLEEGVDVDVDLPGMHLDDEFEQDADQNYSNGAKAARAASGLPIPRSYDVIGDVAVLNSVPEGNEETLKKVGDWILSRNKAIKICVARNNSLSTTDRSPGESGFIQLAGPPRNPVVTSHYEYGVKCVIDLNHCFFSPRMAPERLRLSQLVARGNRVLVVFAGVGMEALLIAARTEASEVVAIEKNAVAAECLRRAKRMLERNKTAICPGAGAGAAARLNVIEGDAMDILPTSEHDYYDRIIAPRPKEGALDGDLGNGDAGLPFLLAMLPLMKSKGEMHWYDFAADHELPECDRTRKTIESACQSCGLEMEVLHVAKAGSVAKRQWRIAVLAAAASESEKGTASVVKKNTSFGPTMEKASRAKLPKTKMPTSVMKKSSNSKGDASSPFLFGSAPALSKTTPPATTTADDHVASKMEAAPAFSLGQSTQEIESTRAQVFKDRRLAIKALSRAENLPHKMATSFAKKDATALANDYVALNTEAAPMFSLGSSTQEPTPVLAHYRRSRAKLPSERIVTSNAKEHSENEEDAGVTNTKKRLAAIQLNRDDHPEGEYSFDGLNDDGERWSDPYKPAPEDILKRRRIVKANKWWNIRIEKRLAPLPDDKKAAFNKAVVTFALADDYGVYGYHTATINNFNSINEGMAAYKDGAHFKAAQESARELMLADNDVTYTGSNLSTWKNSITEAMATYNDTHPKSSHLKSTRKTSSTIQSKSKLEKKFIVTVVDAKGKTLCNCTVSKASKLQAIFLECAVLSDKKSVKSIRLKYKDKNLFLSSAKKVTLGDLGVQPFDTFTIMSSSLNDSDPLKESSVSSCVPTSNVSTSKHKRHEVLQNKSSQKRTQWAGVIDTDSEEYHKKMHSSKMELVFKEAEPKFEVIRKELNDLTIKRTKPKVRSKFKKVKRLPCKQVDHNVDSVGLGAKAGKWSYEVHVGEVDNLYKTSKRDKRAHFQPKFTLDLHGLDKMKALAALDENLPSWIEAAMKSDHPFIVLVEIICGKGGQVLSEVVDQWIKSQKNVAIAPKSK